jgi:hypothetical protein
MNEKETHLLIVHLQIPQVLRILRLVLPLLLLLELPSLLIRIGLLLRRRSGGVGQLLLLLLRSGRGSRLMLLVLVRVVLLRVAVLLWLLLLLRLSIRFCRSQNKVGDGRMRKRGGEKTNVKEEAWPSAHTSPWHARHGLTTLEDRLCRRWTSEKQRDRREDENVPCFCSYFRISCTTFGLSRIDEL